MADDRITTLYNLSEAMTAADKNVKEKHENDYKTMIEYLKTSENTKERVLAAQLISRFFKYFPEHEHDAFDSIVDLCESADVDVRKHATMAMIAICRDCKQVVSKAADILIQLYQTNQPSEVNLISQSLTTLLNLDIEKFLKSFFANFEDGSELVRERAIKFLSAKIHTVSESSLTKEIEELLMNYAKKAMEDVTKDEFIAFIGILSKLKIAKTSSGQATIVSAIKSQAEMDKDFNVNDQAVLEKFILCTRHTVPFLSQYNRASEYINYICLKILPHLKALTPSGNDLNVLQALAEMSPYIILDDVPQLVDLDECTNAVYTKLLEYLPMPPESVEVKTGTVQQQQASEPMVAETTNQKSAETTTVVDGQQSATEIPSSDVNGAAEMKTTNGADSSSSQQQSSGDVKSTRTATSTTTSKPQETDFQFTHIEYLIYTFIQLCRLKSDLFTEIMQMGIRKQLSHLSNGCKKYTNLLDRQLSSVKRGDLLKEENKLRIVALRTTKNISIMIVGLFKRPCDFKTSITLSCKPQKPEPTIAAPRNSNQVSSSQQHQNQHQNQQQQYRSTYQQRSKRFNTDQNSMRGRKKPRTYVN